MSDRQATGNPRNRWPADRLANVMRRVRLLGVPYNSSGLNDGVARAPGALRRAGLVDAIAAAGASVADAGDVALGPTSPDRDPASHLIAPDALREMIEAVREPVQALLDGGFPLVLGGDCPVLLGCLGPGGAPSPLGVLFVDGHEDAWPPADSTTGEAADMELGFALGLTSASLPGPLRRAIPLLDRDRVVVLGARDQREIANGGVMSIDGHVAVARLDAIEERGAAKVAIEAGSRLDVTGDWWLHVDLDVLASDSLAAVDYKQPGGLDWAALTQITSVALASPRCLGWTITIYNPDLDPRGDGASRIVEYVAASLSA